MENVYCDTLQLIDVKSRTKTNSMPYYCAYDQDLNRVYVTDYDNDQVLVYNSLSGEYIARFGKRGRKHLHFNKPTGIAYSYSKKVLVVVDCWNHRIHLISTPKQNRKTSPTKRITRNDSYSKDYKHHSFIGDTKNDSTQPYYLSYPGGVSLDDSLSRIYVADRNGEKIVVFTFEGDPVGLITSGIKMPTGIAFDPESERVYICDQTSKGIKTFTKDGRLINTVGEKPEVSPPYGIVLVKVEDNKVIVMTEMNENRLRFCICGNGSEPSSSYSPGTEEINDVFLIGSEGSGNLEFILPRGICAIGDGCVCVVDSENSRLHFLDVKKILINHKKSLYASPVVPPLVINMPHKTRVPSAHIARLTHLSGNFTPRLQSPRIMTEKLITSARRSRDLRHLCDVALFIGGNSGTTTTGILDYTNVDSFLPSTADSSQEYMDASIEKDKKLLERRVVEWNWDKFSKTDTIFLVKFVLKLQYSMEMNWLVKLITPRIIGLAEKYRVEGLVMSDESALGYNTTTKAVYRTGKLDDDIVFIKTIVLENEIWWHRELQHNTIMKNQDYVTKMRDWYFIYDYDHKYKISFVFDYVENNYASVLAGWIRSGNAPSLKERLRISLGIAKCIAYLHTSHEIIHRDIKLQNILCGEQGKPLLCDLGLAETENLFHIRSLCEGPYDDLAPELTYINSSRLSSSKGPRVIEDPYKIDVYNFGGIVFLLTTVTHHTQIKMIREWEAGSELQSIKSFVMECRSALPEDRPSIENCVERLEALI